MVAALPLLVLLVAAVFAGSGMLYGTPAREALAAPATAFLIVLLLWVPIYSQWYRHGRASFARAQAALAAGDHQRYTLDDSGFTEDCECGTHKVYWHAIAMLLKTPKLYVLVLKNGTMFVLPKRRLTAQAAEGLIAALDGRVTKPLPKAY
jgi:hypothetical protein